MDVSPEIFEAMNRRLPNESLPFRGVHAICVITTTQNEMKALLVVLPLTGVILAGCTFAMRTSVARLDSTPRAAKTGNIEVYQQGKKPTRPYREIALFTVDGEGREEADAVQGFIELGRKFGADAVLVDRTATLKQEGGGKIVSTETKEGVEGGGGETIFYPNARAVFRATAAVWTEQK